MDHEAIFAFIKANPISSPKDFSKIPGYTPSIDFSEGTGRKFAIAYTDYSFSKLDETVCGIDGCKQTHQNGWLVASSDDLITNIGKDCAKRHLNLNFGSVKAALKERRRVESNIETIGKIRSSISEHEERITRIIRIGEVLSSCAFLFKREMRDVSDKVSGMARRKNPAITVPKALKGRDADIYLEQNRLRRSDYPGGIPVIEVQIGVLDGISFFREQISIVVMQNLVKPISEIRELSAEQISEMSPQRLDKMSRMSQDALRAIEVAESFISQGITFFSKSNIDKLSLLGASDSAKEKLLGKAEQHLYPLIN
ncbi:hypothetical protein NA655_08430 [Pseudomonas kuykendallii]|uniref:Uncharacterized protein n=1 Tax=Pseudomonas kuykendallii TaxID=1007099 RepID=A0A1H3EL83_9PSED|nr:hypothetical protein [Pseudomonas kuykendallii]MCQ4271045.1 hypothetical protein [Pseudomonas kuykendallii]SDX79536.1 hypothetical protein SAMN05216287_3776 [Pseudomonas kuykendallii]